MSEQTDMMNRNPAMSGSRMSRSAEIKDLALALAAARTNFSKIAKSKGGQVGHQKFNYAPLDVVYDATIEALSSQKLAHVQSASHANSQIVVTTLLVHGESGQWIETVMEFPYSPGEKDASNPQAFGKVVTYLRRYSFIAIVGVIGEGEEDEDAMRNPESSSRVAARKAAAQQTFNPSQANGNPPTQSELEKAQKTTLDRLYAWAGANTASVQKVAWDTTRQIFGLQPGEERTLDDWRTVYKWIEANKGESFDDVASKALKAAQKGGSDE